MMFNKKYVKLNLAFLAFFDIISVYLAIIIGFKLRFGFVGALPDSYETNMVYYVAIISLVAIMSNMILRCYGSIWRYFSYKDLLRQLGSTLLTSLFIVLIDNFIGLEMPIEMFILIPSLMFLFMVLCRYAPRAYKAFSNKKSLASKKKSTVRTLIYGAGQAGNYLLTNLDQKDKSDTLPVGFIDDDKTLWGRKISNVPVVGGGEILEYIIDDLDIEELIIAIPTAEAKFVKDVYMRCKKCGVVVKQYGSIADVTVEDFKKAPIKQVNFEDLLRRDSVKLNMDIVNKFIKDKVVVVTGGVGSIGSEICRQVLKFGAKKLIIFDINENGLFYIKNEFDERGYSEKFETILGSVRDRNRIKDVFQKYEPSIVFHAAAHKHVPMMEGNPNEAIKNNVLGTINVANEAIFHDVEKFILISTDKAVNPTNIMGASKRIAEISTQIMNNVSDTDFAAVRFGNVLGSNGSVVPFFEKQIEQGGPVTVTHPDMKRYFMTIPEAVQLVLEAGSMATGGEIFVLEMGQPVLIYDLACDLIKMHGLEPNKDIAIEFTGLRPGEKLFEEISLAEEDTFKTNNNKIYINKPVEHDAKEFSRNIKQLENVVKIGDTESMFEVVQGMVSTFNHNNSNNG